ncbi:hypothetical protein ACFQ0M_40315 [Kitasatospora aburaviensis]
MAELLALNPDLPDRLAAARAGDTLTVVRGVTPQSIAVANPDWPVVADTEITLGTLPVQLRAGGTLGGLAHAYGTDPAALVDHLRDTTRCCAPARPCRCPTSCTPGSPSTTRPPSSTSGSASPGPARCRSRTGTSRRSTGSTATPGSHCPRPSRCPTATSPPTPSPGPPCRATPSSTSPPTPR